ncbi:MAG: hypothetical protein JW753_09330 [Dehalococcoidia bacterium]|nr:hypothetical protein [Dehalococcoidia bacterium]
MAAFVSQSDFDFSVRLSTYTMTVKAGQPIYVPVIVRTLKGQPRNITLSTSDWRSAGLSATVSPSPVRSGLGANLKITIPVGTAPGSYVFTVRGSTEGTFKTSNDSITVIVEPETEGTEGYDRQDAPQTQAEQGTGVEPAVSASPSIAKRASLFRSAKKSPSRPVPAGQRALFVVIMFIMIGVLIYYLGVQLRTGFSGSASGMSGTYAGTSTFCIASVLGGSPECGTSATPEIQINSAGDVLGLVLFGKIDGNGYFDGEARAGDGTTFPMTGTFSNGILTVDYESSSVSWTITVHKQ